VDRARGRQRLRDQGQSPHWERSQPTYRELSGYDDPADPVGPEPAANNPDLRAAWHEALAALGPVDGPDVRGMTDGLLLRLRDTYPAETAWAPPWTGDELRQARAAARGAHLGALRATAEASAASRRGERREARRQQELAAATGDVRRLPPARNCAGHRHGRPNRLGTLHPPPAAARRSRRRRTPPTPPQAALAPLRSAEPDHGTGASTQDPAATARLINDLAAPDTTRT
jgi:hypothetical protein